MGLCSREGPADLHATAIFIGGANVAAGEDVLAAVKATFFGPFRVSVLLDANGANTTAAAAVLAASRTLGGSLQDVSAAVFGATGPVGHRVARLLLGLGAKVAVGSRSLDRAAALAETLRQSNHAGLVTPFAATDANDSYRGAQRQLRHRHRGGRGSHASPSNGLEDTCPTSKC